MTKGSHIVGFILSLVLLKIVIKIYLSDTSLCIS